MIIIRFISAIMFIGGARYAVLEDWKEGLILIGVALLLQVFAYLIDRAARGRGKLAVLLNGTVMFLSLAVVAGFLVAVFFFFAPKRNQSAGASVDYNGDGVEGAGGASVKRGVKPEPDAEAAVIDTNFGKIVIELYPNVAPRMVERFKTLARQGFYDGTTFHRINAEVIQGGDPLSKDDDPANDGTGDSPLPNVPAEFSDIPFDRGVVGAARKGSDVNSANCQFYITLQRVPDWDEQYTAFGRVVEGMSNAQIIAGAPRRPGSESPADKIVINSITLQPRADFVR
ncbi:MAG: peptidylprolyl isomerase [Acidobacteriota bacterium]|nr:peptidylprolyl isomerase [Acidobacteriota bacterium]